MLKWITRLIPWIAGLYFAGVVLFIEFPLTQEDYARVAIGRGWDWEQGFREPVDILTSIVIQDSRHGTVIASPDRTGIRVLQPPQTEDRWRHLLQSIVIFLLVFAFFEGLRRSRVPILRLFVVVIFFTHSCGLVFMQILNEDEYLPSAYGSCEVQTEGMDIRLTNFSTGDNRALTFMQVRTNSDSPWRASRNIVSGPTAASPDCEDVDSAYGIVWIAFDSILLRSSDQGESWSVWYPGDVQPPLDTVYQEYMTVESVQFDSAQHGTLRMVPYSNLIGSGTLLFETNDGGVTWHVTGWARGD